VQKPLRLGIAALALALSLHGGAATAAEPGRGAKGRSSQAERAQEKAPGAWRAGRSARAAREKQSGRDRGGDKPRERLPAKKPVPETPAVSVGHPNEGRLEGGARLDDSLPFIRAVSVCPGVDAQWGLPILVRMIERAARAVAKRYPGSVLNVGDISRKQGGEIGGHHSHESGRDADIGFYVADAKGNPIDTRSFFKFEASLATKQMSGARFDLARNWLLIQHLLTDPAARVSHIFIAEPLRQSLLAYARSRGVSRALLHRAAVAMMQPSGSLPHDDHIHVRISCPRSITGAGECVELAKNAPSRLAKGRGRGAPAALVTPGGSRSARVKEARKAAPSAREASKAARRAGGGEALARAEPSHESSDSVLKRAFDAAASGLLGASREDDEPGADAAEVRDAVDESGDAKITD
jgi:penicillin-insensitive murein endopeptidase